MKQSVVSPRWLQWVRGLLAFAVRAAPVKVLERATSVFAETNQRRYLLDEVDPLVIPHASARARNATNA